MIQAQEHEQQQWQIYDKLQQARIALQSTELKKSGYNQFQKYAYFELKDFLPTINKIFGNLGLCHSLEFDKELATMRIFDRDTGGQIKFTCPMAEANMKGNQPVQNLGASITYITRYLFVMSLAICDNDVIDAIDSTDTSEPIKRKKTISATDGAKDSLNSSLAALVDKLSAHIQAQFDAGNEWTCFEAWSLRDKTTFDETASTAVWSQLSSKCRSTIKLMIEESKGK